MNKSSSLKIAYIGGGSSMWARMLMSDLALEPELSGEIRLYDINIKAAKCNEIIGNRLSADSNTLGKWQYRTVPALRDALTGADFVIISILPGNMAHMRVDVHMPERLGIYQSVGDTTGPGGIMRALRVIPAYVEFAEAIKAYAPDAWVINYTNPMALCVRTLYHVFPEIKAFGCCHEVFSTQQLLCEMIKREYGTDAKRRDIMTNVIGLNHFTWIDSASYKDTDLMSIYARYAKDYYDTGFTSEEFDKQHADVFMSRNRVKFDLFASYGQIAAAGDRHLAEFMPGDIYLKDLETVKSWGFRLTPVDWRITDYASKVKLTARLISGEEIITPKPSGEEGLLLIKALCGLCDVASNVNMPNTSSQIGNLPHETVVETNALFSRDNVKPISAGLLKLDILHRIIPHAQNQTKVLNAALCCDREAIYRAFERDPLVHERCKESDARTLVDDMIEGTLDVLPEGWKIQG